MSNVSTVVVRVTRPNSPATVELYRGPAVVAGGGGAGLPIESTNVLVDALVVSGFLVETDYNGVYVRSDTDGDGRGIYTNGDGAWLLYGEDSESRPMWGFGGRTWVDPIAYAESTEIYPWDVPQAAWVANVLKGGDGPPTVVRSTMLQHEAAAARFASTKAAPTTRNATAGEVVTGSDTRLTNARTPTAHAASHATGGSDAITPAAIGAATAGHGHTWADISGKPATFAPTAHAASHAEGGSDAITPVAIGAATAAQGALADSAQQPYLCRSAHDGTYLYVGRAAVGTAESAAAWTIKRQAFSGTATITTTTATGVAWTDRLTATYT